MSVIVPLPAVDHLSEYLAMRLVLEQGASASQNVFSVCIAVTPGKFTPLSGNMTLGQVNEKYGEPSKPLEVYYALPKTDDTSV